MAGIFNYRLEVAEHSVAITDSLKTMMTVSVWGLAPTDICVRLADSTDFIAIRRMSSLCELDLVSHVQVLIQCSID